MNILFYRFLGVFRKIYYICLTDYNREKIIHSKSFEKLGLSESQFFVKFNFVKDVKEERIHASDMKEPYFLYCGRLSEEKGVLTLLKAWKIYRSSLDTSTDAVEPCRLVVLGDGELMQECRNIAEEIGDGSVLLLGATENEIAHQYMQYAIATIVPSECYEGCSLTTLEAFSHGCPVIGSDIGNIKLTVKPGINGYHFRAGDSQSLAETILYVSKHRDEEMKKGAFDTFVKYYSEERNLQVLEEIYAKISGEIQYGEG